MKKPRLKDDVLDWWDYMNRLNPNEDGSTPMSQEDVECLFGYVRLLEEKVVASGGTLASLRNSLGLGKGRRGTGLPDRATIRARLKRIQRRRHRRAAAVRKESLEGTLPVYTARFERSEGWWVGSVDEMPGVNSQGRTLASVMTRLAAITRVEMKMGTAWEEEWLRRRNARKARRARASRVRPKGR